MISRLHANNTDGILGKCREDTQKKPGESGEYLKGCMCFLQLFHLCLLSVATYPSPYHLYFTWASFQLQLLFLPIKDILIKGKCQIPAVF